MRIPTFKLLCLLAIIVMLNGCNTMQRIHTRELMTEFDETFIQYSKHLRWGHFRQLTTFMTQEHVAPTLAKIDSLKNIRISDVKPITWILDEEKGVMVGDVVIDYYITNKAIIRQTTQNQVWRWADEHWKLDSGLPDLL
jgi:hypothetical protein